VRGGASGPFGIRGSCISRLDGPGLQSHFKKINGKYYVLVTCSMQGGLSMKLSFIQKLWLPLILSLAFLAAISIYNAYKTKVSMTSVSSKGWPP
jgi:hypothetical protein